MEKKTNKIKLSYVNREYSPGKFLHYIEQRVRKDIRINKDIRPKDTIYLFNDDSKEFKIAKHFLRSIFGNNIDLKETKSKSVKGKLVVPTNLEREASENLRNFLGNTNKEQLCTLILDNVLEEEIVEVCKILKIKAEKSEKTHVLIEKMEESYPGTKFSLHNSFQKLQQL